MHGSEIGLRYGVKRAARAIPIYCLPLIWQSTCISGGTYTDSHSRVGRNLTMYLLHIIFEEQTMVEEDMQMQLSLN